MKSTWNNGQGHRDRQAMAAVITATGDAFRFTGASIPSVCHALKVAYEKKGKWSNTTWEITHADTTTFVSWMQDWDTGESFPQPSWAEGFRWLATKAPALRREAFEAMVRASWPKAAEKWDAAAAAAAEFETPATADQLAQIAAAKAEVERLNAEAKEAAAAASELRAATEQARRAKAEHDRALTALATARAEAAELEGVDAATLAAETSAVWGEIVELERKLSAARAKKEAEAKKAELGNSLGNAFASLGL